MDGYRISDICAPLHTQGNHLVIDRCERYDMVMAFTGLRLFILEPYGICGCLPGGRFLLQKLIV